MVIKFARLEDMDVSGKVVLLRTDLNVPRQGGIITDNTRIMRLLPTLNYLIKQKSKIVLLSHFGRPKGKFVPSLSLASLVDPLSEALSGKEVTFSVDCVGPDAQEAVAALKPGGVLLLENLRFHPEEEKGTASFAKALASLGDVYINDAFSACHRAHASITGITEYLPVAAGRLMQEELEVLSGIFTNAKKPIGAIIGGSKVSTKLELLENMTDTMDKVVIGGAMANTFLHAKGIHIGKSLCEKEMKATALKILKKAEANGCEILLPVDLVAADAFEPHSNCTIVDAKKMPAHGMAIDVGPESVELFSKHIRACKTVIWNGPMGAFEMSPFDVSTVSLARVVAKLTADGTLRSIAGGGDTVSALNHAGLGESFSYLSTAGGAFLEWLEGKTLPGVAALIDSYSSPKAKARA